jgi:Na+-translocating ferredoxin:NAD+ oxidoreductase RnfD subunit
MSYASHVQRLEKAWKDYQAHDPRYWIAAAQFTYICLGFTVLGFNRTPYQVALLSLSACTFEVLLHRLFKRKWILPLSALITSFGLSLLLNYSHDYWLVLVPVFFAIGSKYIFTFDGRHYINPALAGVYFSLLLGEGFISSAPAYQWRGIASMAVFIAMFGLLFLLPRINRHYLVGSFLLTFTLQTALRAWIMRHHLPFETLFFGTITTPAFFLFSFFMITDPATSPRSKRGQILFGVLLGIVDLAFHLKQAYGTFFKSLFWLSMGRLLLAHGRNLISVQRQWPRELWNRFSSGRYWLQPAGLGLLALLAVTTYRGVIAPRLPQENLGWRFEEVPSSVSGVTGHPGDVLHRLDPRVQHMGKWLLSVGDSVASSDVDGDGYPDLFLTQPLKAESERAVLLLNRKSGIAFQPVEIPALQDRNRSPEVFGIATNGVFVDFDNDSDLDLLVVYAFGSPLLLKNQLRETGILRFDDVSRRAGLELYRNAIAANFGDFNSDGRLDLVLGSVWPSHLPDYATPTPLNLFRLPQPEYAGDIRMFNFMHESWNLANNGGELELFLQDASGRFIKQDSVKAGFRENRWTLAIGVGDLNRDSHPDFYVANDFGPDQLFLNEGQGVAFREVEGPFFGTVGRDTYKGMNATLADFDRNGWLDVYVSNVHHVLQAEGSLLWMFSSPKKAGKDLVIPEIEDRATELGALNEDRFGWGAAAADLDNDGWIDLVQANGMVNDTWDRKFEKCPDFWYTNERIALSPPSIHRYIHHWGDIRGRCIYGQEKDRVYLNRGTRKGQTFLDVASVVGLNRPGTSRGVAAADFDRDGRLDLAISHPFGPTTLHHNQLKPDSFRDSLPVNWIQLKMVGDGVRCNRDAIGTRVEIGPQMREVHAVNGFSGQSDPVLHFGLGESSAEVTVRIRWCGRFESEVRGLTVNRRHEIKMPASGLAALKEL